MNPERHSLLCSHWLAVAFIFFLPLLSMLIYSDFIRESEFNARLGWLFLAGGTAYLLRQKLLTLFFKLVLAAFLIVGIIDIFYAAGFGGVFTTATFSAMAGTDQKESIEFLLSYFSFEITAWLIVYIGLGTYLISHLKIAKAQGKGRKFLVGFGVVMVTFAFQQVQQRNRYMDVFPGFSGVAMGYYGGVKQSMQELMQRRQELLASKPFSASKNKNLPQTHIIVIGESLNRNHLSLYGYPRKTTPELDQRRDNIWVQTNTISNYAQTQPSLKGALTEFDSHQMRDYAKAISLNGVLKKAGYSTWWLSNQQPNRVPAAPLAAISDYANFISNEFHGVMVDRYDGFLLPHIKTAIENEAAHKVIFVHTMGSHLQYKNRYPNDRFGFSGSENLRAYSDELSSRQLDFINSYDASVQYTDFVLSEIINMLEEQQGASTLTFFSDHGEEVYDSFDFKGHGPDKVSRHMLEVPFFVWRNRVYQETFTEQENALEKAQDTPSMLEDFFHFALGLYDISTDLYRPESNILDPGYQSRKRTVYKKDYDTELR